MSNRLSRAGRAWFGLRKRLMGSRLSKRKQARVIEACVETALLFDCQVRVWHIRVNLLSAEFHGKMLSLRLGKQEEAASNPDAGGTEEHV